MALLAQHRTEACVGYKQVEHGGPLGNYTQRGSVEDVEMGKLETSMRTSAYDDDVRQDVGPQSQDGAEKVAADVDDVGVHEVGLMLVACSGLVGGGREADVGVASVGWKRHGSQLRSMEEQPEF